MTWLVTTSCGTISGIANEEPRKKIAALERELQRARHEAEKNQAALSALDDQRREREGRLAVALRAQQDLEERLERKRVELARAEAEAELEAFKQLLADRDAAAEAFASAARSVMLRLQEFDAAQESSESAWQSVLRSRGAAEGGAEPLELPDDDLYAHPDVFTGALTMLIELVSQRADRELERDLVEAAARSPLGNDISTLPLHLQELARARYFAIARERRERKHANRGLGIRLFGSGRDMSEQDQDEAEGDDTAREERLTAPGPGSPTGETVAEESGRPEDTPTIGGDDQTTQHDAPAGDSGVPEDASRD